MCCYPLKNEWGADLHFKCIQDLIWTCYKLNVFLKLGVNLFLSDISNFIFFQIFYLNGQILTKKNVYNTVERKVMYLFLCITVCNLFRLNK